MNSLRKVTIVTMTYNCVEEMQGYLLAFLKLDRRHFDWLVMDAGSTDGTAEFLALHKENFDFYLSESDSGFYFGLNKALSQIKTPYYMVFGADDRPSADLFSFILPLIEDHQPMLVLGGVNIVPVGTVKMPGPRWMHEFVLGRAVSHHSVGTVISMEAHKIFGKYDTSYTLVADGLLLKRILNSHYIVRYSKDVFGDFRLGGMSSKNDLRSILEAFQIQITEGSSLMLQLPFFCLRIIKRSILQILRLR